jgi:hypothetical protein
MTQDVYDVLKPSRVTPVPGRVPTRWECSHGYDRARKGHEAGAERSRGIDEALETVRELELRRRF